MKTQAPALTLDAAEKALRFVFQNPPLQFKRSQITLDAAVFAFQVLIKVDQASRASLGLFKLWSPIPVRSWAGISKIFVKAVIAALKDPTKYGRSKIGATVAITYRRLLQAHLAEPSTFPCPEYRM
ncbi:hypothetical protein MYX65_03690 [Acidobacteria bacterium AH-259-L09]|nr:hypothetical protein [Acidobacteria bacterium AH-259-L09]